MSYRFVVTDFVSALIANDKQGKRTEYHSRYAAALIITLQGRIRFSYGTEAVEASPMHTVFLPQGADYINECIEDAKSIVINFRTLVSPKELLQCPAILPTEALSCFQILQERAFSSDVQSQCECLTCIYSLGGKMLQGIQSEPISEHPIIAKALRYLQLNCESPRLTIADVARECHISEVYLRKLFGRELKVSPYQKLVEIRMKKAYLLTKEKRPIKEIASCCGYSDVFQFSRAYKRFFGYPPSEA